MAAQIGIKSGTKPSLREPIFTYLSWKVFYNTYSGAIPEVFMNLIPNMC